MDLINLVRLQIGDRWHRTHSQDIVKGYMLGHSNNKRHFGFYGFLNGRRRLMRCDVDTGGIWLELLYRLRGCKYLVQFSVLRGKRG